MYKWTGIPQKEVDKLDKYLSLYGVACLTKDLKAITLKEAIKRNNGILITTEQERRLIWQEEHLMNAGKRNQ